MRLLTILLLLVLSGLFFQCSNIKSSKTKRSEVALVIHGGAGTIRKANMTPELEKAYQQKLEEALKTGFTILNNGGSSMDAVEAVIVLLEDSPLFNAGKGSVYNENGKNEMDASLMDGKTLNAGAVAGITNIKNPIILARAVMENSPHVMLISTGAVEFALSQGFELVEDEYFYTERRWNQLQRSKERGDNILDQSNDNADPDDLKFGTVGAVALDRNGNISAGTSTGGTTNKKFGRVGDSPIIGAGTYANNKTCGISSTGTGEFFIRNIVAYDISALMEYKNYSIQKAAKEVIHQKLRSIGGDGGVVGLDRYGNVMMEFNTEGMYRGFIKSDGVPNVFFYNQE